MRPPPGQLHVPIFRISGQIYHRTGPLHPPANRAPEYNQLYIYDGAEALQHRIAGNIFRQAPLLEAVVHIVQHTIDRFNPYAHLYKYAYQQEQEAVEQAHQQGLEQPRIRVIFNEGVNRRRENRPQINEVAAVFVDQDGAPPPRQTVIYGHDNRLTQLPTLSPHLDPMVYPLFFPSGEPGFSVGIPHHPERRTAQHNTVTMREYYCFYLSPRNNFSPILFPSPLLQQYCVDQYVKIEDNNLNFHRNNQNRLRVERYQGLLDYLNEDNNNNRQPGIPVILPATFPGSARNMVQNYQDALSIVAKYGKPDLFVTITCNPRWPEITNNLPAGESPYNAPHLTVRVFKMYFDRIMNEIWQQGLFGRISNFIYTIEFQKRGLPHAHVLFTLFNDEKLRNPADIDSIISAEIPNRNHHPLLFQTVSSSMIHGPCGDLNPQSPCMINGTCSKHFPKDFSDETLLPANGPPQYKRSNDGRTVTKRVNGRNLELGNNWVVPYNPYLCQKFQCHINVEYCSSHRAVKYLYKYIFKGHDLANLVIQEQQGYNEIEHYVRGRYVGPCEATYRIFSFTLNDTSHTIHRLAVHLPFQQNVYFQQGQHQQAIDRAQERETTLTAYFSLNQRDPEAHQFLYSDIVHNYCFGKFNNVYKWKKRQRRQHGLIGRVYNVSPREVERFHLRILLYHVRGATSFQHLRTVDNNILPTFKEACAALHLIEDGELWIQSVRDVTLTHMPVQLRRFFAYLLIFCQVNNPLDIWQQFVDDFIEDFTHRGIPREIAIANALAEIQAVLAQHNLTLGDFQLPNNVQPEIPQPIDRQQAREEARQLFATLNNDQRNVAQQVFNSIDLEEIEPEPQPRIFFLDGPAGSGKTYLYKYLVKELTSQNKTFITAAWTGIAATLLEKGQTIHSTFKLPIPLLPNSTCRIPPNSNIAQQLRNSSLIILDEASMIPKTAFHCIDRCLQDITNTNVPFAGKTILLGGDFRQTLPIPSRHFPQPVTDTCITSSILWPNIDNLQLHINMRARQNQAPFADFLLQLGNGLIPQKLEQPFLHSIALPRQCVVNENITNLIFPNNLPLNDYAHRIVVTPTNDTALRLNNSILQRLPGDIVHIFSADSIHGDDLENPEQYPLNYINSLTPNGMPPHDLQLKPNCIVTLLRNINPRNGLCNGTRLQVVTIQQRYLQCRHITAQYNGQEVILPKIALQPSELNLPFQLRRIQFPVRLAYATTINKAQGQTYEKVGIYLDRPCFSHGQLYVACSRARSFDDLKIQVVPSNEQGQNEGITYTKNVVLPDIIQLLNA